MKEGVLTKDYFSGDIHVSDDLDDSLVDTSSPVIDLPVGTVIEDRYEVMEYLGNGTSAVVYKCQDRLLGNLVVAMKVISGSVIDDPVATTRLYRELLTNFDFDHENIARFYDCIRGPDYIALVMEYVKGGTLEDLFEDEYYFMPEEIRSILVQICKALEVIHGAGIVHRDLKPENVLLTESGIVKIADFGLARGNKACEELEVSVEDPKIFQNDEIAKRATVTGGVAGSPLYLAPEYIAKGEVSALSDIYALGIIGYQLLTGQEPYPHDSLVEMLKAKLKEKPDSIQMVNPHMSAEFALIIEKAMEIKPSARYSDVLQIRRALEQLNLGSLTQTYTQSFIDQQVKDVQRPSIFKLLFNAYLWPFKMIVEGLSYLGNLFFLMSVISVIGGLIYIAYLVFGPALGLNMGETYETLPVWLANIVENIRQSLKLI